MTHLNFWNGNKSPARQQFESELIQLIMQETRVQVDNTNYPLAKDETDIFNKGADVLVTVAGNSKFNGVELIEIEQPICNGLLGHRTLITRTNDQHRFEQITRDELKLLKVGIPATWADADLFRANGYQVFEDGSLDTIFDDLSCGKCDYIALGANEVEEIYSSFCQNHKDLEIESSLMLYYPMPLVFYVNPSRPHFAKTIKNRLKEVIVNGEFEQLFSKHYGSVVQNLNLAKRNKLTLVNPFLPEVYQSFQPELG